MSNFGTKNSICRPPWFFSKFQNDGHHSWDIPKYHTEYENDAMSGFWDLTQVALTDACMHKADSKIPLHKETEWNKSRIMVFTNLKNENGLFSNLNKMSISHLNKYHNLKSQISKTIFTLSQIHGVENMRLTLSLK